MSDCWPGYEGDPKDSGFKSTDFRPVLGCVGDSEIIFCLVRVGMNNPDIFSLVWGQDMSTKSGKCFPPKLKKIVFDIIQEMEKKEEAIDSQEVKICDIIIDLLEVLYEKEVNDIVKIILER